MTRYFFIGTPLPPTPTLLSHPFHCDRPTKFARSRSHWSLHLRRLHLTHSEASRPIICSSTGGTSSRGSQHTNADKTAGGSNDGEKDIEIGPEKTNREPVEDGLTLPPVSSDSLRVEASWLEIEVRSWLDDEWRSADAWNAHRGIAHRTAQLYERLRAERVDDLSSLMLGLGSGLEGESTTADFSKSYVGPWTIANKVAELLVAKFHPARSAQIQAEEYMNQANRPWSVLDEALREENDENDENFSTEDIPLNQSESRRPASPSLADEFERYRFLQMVLNGAASKPVCYEHRIFFQAHSCLLTTSMVRHQTKFLISNFVFANFFLLLYK